MPKTSPDEWVSGYRNLNKAIDATIGIRVHEKTRQITKYHLTSGYFFNIFEF